MSHFLEQRAADAVLGAERAAKTDGDIVDDSANVTCVRFLVGDRFSSIEREERNEVNISVA